MYPRRHPPAILAILFLLALAVVAACGSAAADDGVASLDDPADGASAAPSASVDPEAAFLAFAECMREHGVDMPDPQVGDDGGIVRVAPIAGGGANAGEGPDMDAFQAANEACREHLAGVVQEGGPREIPEEDQQALLDFAKCMREHGVDMPDPQFDSGGGFVVGIGGPGGEGGDGGPRIDFESDEFQAAQEACQDLLPGVLGGDGPGSGPAVEVKP